MTVQNQPHRNPCSQTEPFCLRTVLISPCMTSPTAGRDTVPLRWCGANRRGKNTPQSSCDARGSSAGAAIGRWGYADPTLLQWQHRSSGSTSLCGAGGKGGNKLYLIKAHYSKEASCTLKDSGRCSTFEMVMLNSVIILQVDRGTEILAEPNILEHQQRFMLLASTPEFTIWTSGQQRPGTCGVWFFSAWSQHLRYVSWITP